MGVMSWSLKRWVEQQLDELAYQLQQGAYDCACQWLAAWRGEIRGEGGGLVWSWKHLAHRLQEHLQHLLWEPM